MGSEHDLSFVYVRIADQPEISLSLSFVKAALGIKPRPKQAARLQLVQSERPVLKFPLPSITEARRERGPDCITPEEFAMGSALSAKRSEHFLVCDDCRAEHTGLMNL